MKRVQNASSLPEVYYGLHMVEGVAEYSEPGKKPYRIFIGESAIKNMNPSFQGKPVYVDHVDEVDLENLEQEADGYVVESFYNKSDGKNWVKFLVVSDKGKEAIRMGWKLSNAYIPTGFAGGGECHAVSFEKEVTSGEYEHLAIVRHPRYEESNILTPEEFKAYNNEKESEILRLANSKTTKGNPMKLNIFKRTKVENSTIDENMIVQLPLSKKELSIVQICNAYDKILNMHGYANGDHLVKVGENEMSVNDLVKKHMDMENANKEREEAEMNAGGEGEPGEDIEYNDEDEHGTEEAGEEDVGDRGGDTHMNDEDEQVGEGAEIEQPKKKKMNSAQIAAKKAADAKAIKLANDKKKADAVKKAAALKIANQRNFDEETSIVETSSDQVARGQQRYGS